MQVKWRNIGGRPHNIASIGLVCVIATWGPLDELCDLSPAASAAEEPTHIELTPALREQVLSVLREALASDEFWPSMHAAEALTLAGHGDEVRQALEPRVASEPDDQQRCGLARELVRAGDRSKAALMLDILAGEDTYGHTHASESLYKVFEIGDGRLLRRTMQQTQDSKCKLMAAAALARCGSAPAMEFLREELESDDLEAVRIASWILARIGGPVDIPAIRRGLERAEDRLARAYFEHALATLGDAAGRAALARNLQHELPAVRTYAATFAGDARMVSVAGQLAKLLSDENTDVRVRAAQSLAVLAQPPVSIGDDVITNDVYPATAENPRYSEGTILTLHDGRILYATTEFVGGGSDFSTASIIARESNDGGRTWGPSRVLQENVGQRNVMSASLCYLAAPHREETPIGLFYLVKNGVDDLDVYLRKSVDQARTFGEPILVSDTPGYHVMNNDRVTLLSSGRLLAPVASTADVRTENHFVSYCFLSDDGGTTWRAGRDKVDLPKRGAMEPEVIEMQDGRVAMILRTQLGHIAVSYSTDGGESWSEPSSWGVRAPEAPATLRRIPATGDLLLIWNDTFTDGSDHGGKRTPLTAAVSTDEGQSWQHRRNLETRDDETYAYTSLTFHHDRALLSYYVRDESNGRISSRFRSVPISWFYQR